MASQFDVRVSIPAKLAELYAPWRYKVLHSGRGAGKSHSVAQVLLDIAAQRTMRVLCGREIQKSMKDSVHRLLRDYIASMGLGQFYEVTDTEIRGINGSVFLFSGLRQHTVESIKSFEGIDIVWVEEAQTVSKRSWDVLIPTIRKPGSEIWMTLNPDMETDETYTRFVLNADEDMLVIQMNWRDNPWFAESEMAAERERDQRTKSEEDYRNIWEGEARTVAEGAIYRREILSVVADGRLTDLPYDPARPVFTAWDLGWNDAMAIIMFQVTPHAVHIINYLEDSHRTLDWYVGELEKNAYRWDTDYLPHDARAADFKTGQSTEDILAGMGRRTYVPAGMPVVNDGIRAARMMFPRVYFDRNKAARLFECLKRYRRDISTRTQEARLPLHDEYSHGADAFRYLAAVVEHALRRSRGHQQRAVSVPRHAAPRRAAGWMGS